MPFYKPREREVLELDPQGKPVRVVDVHQHIRENYFDLTCFELAEQARKKAAPLLEEGKSLRRKHFRHYKNRTGMTRRFWDSPEYGEYRREVREKFPWLVFYNTNHTRNLKRVPDSASTTVYDLLRDWRALTGARRQAVYNLIAFVYEDEVVAALAKE